MTLQRRDLMPMFAVTNIVDGKRFEYADAWQRAHLLLVTIPRNDPTEAAYIASLMARQNELRASDVRLVITSDAVPGVPSPSVVIADRWGEIYLVEEAGSATLDFARDGSQQGRRAADLPAADALLEWLGYVQRVCPECEGETR